MVMGEERSHAERAGVSGLQMLNFG